MNIGQNQLPKGWEIKKLGEVCEYDKSPNKSINLPYVGLENIESNTGKFIGSYEIQQVKSSTFYFTKKHILYGRLRPYLNKVLLPNFEGHCSTEIFPIKVKKDLDRRFLFYWLTSNDIVKKIVATWTGTRMPRANMNAVIEFYFPLPPLPEQQRIVTILDAAFAAIDRAKAIAEQNLKNSKEIFESYLQGVFENLKDNWEKKKWGELCNFVRGPFGGSLKKSIFKEEGFVVYEQKHAIHDHFNQLRYFIDEDKFNEMKRFEVKPGDIIMSCSGVTLGKVAIIPENIQRGIINQALLKLTPKKNISVHFLKHWLRSKIFQDIIFEYSGGAAIPNVPSAKILKDIMIPLPSLNEQNQIVDNIEIISAKSKKLESIYQKKILYLEELKKSILQKAFRGELTEKGVAV